VQGDEGPVEHLLEIERAGDVSAKLEEELAVVEGDKATVPAAARGHRVALLGVCGVFPRLGDAVTGG